MSLLSVIIPAHNEAAFIGACLTSIEAAAARISVPVEMVVVCNRCTDDTETIARDHGCQVVFEDAKNLSKIRNAGARAASGDTFVTIDADSRMSPLMLSEVLRLLDTGRYVGGGVLNIKPERWSLGIVCSGLVLLPFLLYHGVSCGLFWCRKSDFFAIGGFNEAMVSVEDVDFGKRLKAHGRKTGRRYGGIMRAHIETSCRKFDLFGDWFLVRDPMIVWRAFQGVNRELADRLWYDARS